MRALPLRKIRGKTRKYINENLIIEERDGYIDVLSFLNQLDQLGIELKDLEDLDNLENDELWYDDFIKKYGKYIDDVENLKRGIEENLFYDYYFYKRPPTPEEFLDYHNGWITKDLYKSLFESVKEDFINILNGNYDTISIYGATRIGKSYLSRLLILYTIVYMNHIKRINELFSIAQGTKLKIYIMSFDFNKTNEIYVIPLQNLLETLQDRFVYVKRKDAIRYFDGEKIYWSKANLNKHIHISTSNIELLSGNADILNMLGSDLLQSYISEISFFVNKRGIKETEILDLYFKSLDRIKGTAENTFLSYVFLDTSANKEDSPIENYILKNLKDDKKTYFKWYKRWDIKEKVEKECPIYSNTGKIFYLYLGDKDNDPFVSLEIKNTSKKLDPNRIIEVPIDYWDIFNKNLTNSIRDIAGYPTYTENRFINSDKVIEDIFDDHLWNIESSVILDLSSSIDLFSLIKDYLFTKDIDGFYRLKDNPHLPRFIGLDLSKSAKGDLTGICMLYVIKENGLYKYICDFCFGIRGSTHGIDLEKIQNFIIDLYNIGKVNIFKVFSDMAYSEMIFQKLQKIGIKCETQSVVRNMEPYLYLSKKMYEGAIKVGRNIILKNNLKSLVEVNMKIDHTYGDIYYEYNGDWENSLCGINQKDVSDALCQAVYGAYRSDYNPIDFIQEDGNDISNMIKNTFFV